MVRSFGGHNPKGVHDEAKFRVLVGSAILGVLAFAQPASASGGTFNCGPSLRLKIYTNLGRILGPSRILSMVR